MHLNYHFLIYSMFGNINHFWSESVCSGRTNSEKDLQITRDLGEGVYRDKKKKCHTPIRAEWDQWNRLIRDADEEQRYDAECIVLRWNIKKKSETVNNY